ncbi:MAG: SPOR domain-containing protein [Erythrobacter sp.]|nr:SPOR domain-containing protein [Erythrobacter sp.]
MIDAEYEELNEADDELDLASTDSLPWLESDDADDDAGGVDTGQIIGFVAILAALLVIAVGGVWFISNKTGSSQAVADGGVIAAPAGPIKSRPEDPGGKEFAGTGNVAPVVGEGGTRPAVVASGATPPLPGAPATGPAKSPATKPVPAASPSAAPAAATGVGVQLAAYGTRARAEQGWSDLSRRTGALAGVKYRVVEGKVDIGTVYRLQAVTPDRAAAEKLCAALKADGLDCQIK